MANTVQDEGTIFTVYRKRGSLMGVDGQMAETWQQHGLPATHLIEPQGQSRDRARAAGTWINRLIRIFYSP